MTTIVKPTEVAFRGRAVELGAVRQGLAAPGRGQGAVVALPGVPGSSNDGVRLLQDALRIYDESGAQRCTAASAAGCGNWVCTGAAASG